MIVAAGATVAMAGDLEFATGTAAARIDWSKCPEGLPHLECARVRVPLDWDRPDGAKITLKVIRHLASRPEQRIGSLFVNFGGPGVAGAATVRATGKFLDKLGDGRFDVVGWDPRGTGESTHVRCFAERRGPGAVLGSRLDDTHDARGVARYVPQTVDYARRCEALSGALLAHISTKDTVRDLDYLRQLVGDRQLTYRGLSYGTFLGQTYANMFPHRVRAMILDGVIDAVEFTTSVEAAIAKQRGRERPGVRAVPGAVSGRRVRRNAHLQPRARSRRGSARCCSACAWGRSRRDRRPRHANFATAMR